METIFVTVGWIKANSADVISWAKNFRDIDAPVSEAIMFPGRPKPDDWEDSQTTIRESIVWLAQSHQRGASNIICRGPSGEIVFEAQAYEKGALSLNIRPDTQQEDTEC